MLTVALSAACIALPSCAANPPHPPITPIVPDPPSAASAPGDLGRVPLTSVDPAPTTAPSVTLNGQGGVMIYQDWLASGRLTTIRPGAPLQWPTAISSNGTATISASTLSKPFTPRVEVRLFSRPIPASGLPDEDPVVLKCQPLEQTAPLPANPFTASCTLRKPTDMLTWDITRIPAKTTAMIFNVSWYVPMRERMDVPHSQPLDTVAVGWKIVTHH